MSVGHRSGLNLTIERSLKNEPPGIAPAVLIIDVWRV
jgi:hypothetical protein